MVRQLYYCITANFVILTQFQIFSILFDSWLFFLSEAAVCRYLSKLVFLKFRNIHKKTTVLESLFNKVKGLLGLWPAILLKRNPNTGVSL